MQNINSVKTTHKNLELFHTQSNTSLHLPTNSKVLNIGKYSEETSPDIDVSHLPNADIISRNHATIYMQEDGCFIEDLGSSNGTYIIRGNKAACKLEIHQRYRLYLGDKIEFGQKSQVTFIFQQQSQQSVALIHTTPTLIYPEPKANHQTSGIDRNSKIVGFTSMVIGVAIFAANTNVGFLIGFPGILLIIGGGVTLKWGGQYSKFGWIAIALGGCFIIFGGSLIATFNLLSILLSAVLVGGGYLLLKTGKVWKYSLSDVKQLLLRRGQ